MSEQAGVEKKFNWAGLIIGLGVSGGALFLLASLVDLAAVAEYIQRVNISTLAIAVVFFFATLFARSAAWRTILEEKISFSRAFWTENEGYLFNNLLPFRLGEVARAFLLNRTEGLPFWQVFSTIVVERVFDIALLAALLLSTVPFVVGVEGAEKAAYAAAGVVLVGFLALFWVARNQETVMRIYDKVTAPLPKLADFGREKLESVLSGLTALQDFSRFSKALGLLLLAWVCNIAWYTVLLWAFVPGAKVLWSAFAVGFVALGVSAPSSPGYIGVFEAAEVYALTRFPISEEVALAYAIIAHSLYLVITIALGAIGLMRDGQSLGEVYRGIRNRPENTKPPSE
jgi:uncharacterized protein (TIRG00374 family)